MDRQQIFYFVNRQYGTEPEYLWKKYPNYAVLRNSAGKWYGAVVDVPKNKIGLDGEETVDILDVKCDPLLIGSLCMQQGFLPAYHMNKENWIGIMLDGSVDDEQIKNLLDVSYNLTMPKLKRAVKQPKL
ncbi:MAG: MmcQ/YjbR family DNA-binding protein [Oscillospiraceae bacterium]|nr:MmcQ/YjbR family DNA-binding protein [Oscillospiraceae bacterium]